MTKIAIFASGRGSNARSIIDFFETNDEIEVSLVVSNRKMAGVLDLANEYNIPKAYFPKNEFYENDGVGDLLKKHNISLIVLAGFLLKIPSFLLELYPDNIINIHPALLPKYGGKGMFGRHVHEAVFENNEIETGVTIHLVNENYDEGKILFQASKELVPEDNPESIAKKVLELEHFYFPRVIKAFVENSFEEEPSE